MASSRFNEASRLHFISLWSRISANDICSNGLVDRFASGNMLTCLNLLDDKRWVARMALYLPPNFLDTDTLRFNVAVFGNETATLPIRRMSGASRIATVSILFTAPSSKFDIPKVLKCELVDEAGNALCSLMVDIPQIKDLAIHPAKVLVTQPLDQNPLRFRLYGKEVAPMAISVAGLSKNDWSVETDDCPRSKILWLKSLPHDIETEVIHIKANLGEERIPFVVLRR